MQWPTRVGADMTNIIPLTYGRAQSTEEMNTRLMAVAKNLEVSRRIGRETYHPATRTKAAMLVNADPRFVNIRDGVKADRQDYTILVIGLALGAAALVAWIA